MPLGDSFHFVPRNIREWGQFFRAIKVVADDGTTDTPQLADNSVTLAKMADIATKTVMGRNTAGTGDPEVLAAATARTVLDNSNVVTVTTTPYTSVNQRVILVDDDTIGGAATVNLKTAVGILGFIYHIKKLGTTGFVTLDGFGSQTIDGGLTAILTAQFECLTICSDNVNWQIL